MRRFWTIDRFVYTVWGVAGGCMVAFFIVLAVMHHSDSYPAQRDRAVLALIRAETSLDRALTAEASAEVGYIKALRASAEKP